MADRKSAQRDVAHINAPMKKSKQTKQTKQTTPDKHTQTNATPDDKR
jgi:hypothetical protein